ncbi:MAG TPA: tetratricopeptide repeat protein, partial [Planctomycetota bacterium]|nr:tetratricopeptide repeat protein [Planctomycetota bacterium]
MARRFASEAERLHTVGLQWILFLGGALLLANLLPHVPGIGRVFGGIWGFWIAVILMSALVARFSGQLLERRRMRRQLAEFGRVETAHNQGKLGTLMLQRGSVRSAIPALERAVAGEPGVAEWRYRLGVALRASGEPGRAAKELEAALALAPAHAYGE